MKSLIDMRNGAKIDGTNYKLLLKHIRLNVTDKYEFPPEIIKVNGTTVATLGNFSASTGKPKSKKTFNVSALVASALSGKEVLKYKTILPQGKERILYVDTEQSKCHCHKVMQRIMKLAALLSCSPERLQQSLHALLEQGDVILRKDGRLERMKN